MKRNIIIVAIVVLTLLLTNIATYFITSNSSYSKGKNAGYKEGYSKGEKKGYENGSSDGWNDLKLICTNPLIQDGVLKEDCSPK